MFESIKSKAKKALSVAGQITRDTVTFAAPGLITGGAVIVATAPTVLGVMFISSYMLVLFVLFMLFLGLSVAVIKYAIEQDLKNKLFEITGGMAC
jgi:hypothetical protein